MKKAFTLAEVLVTLGIIGIVSALTIPTLMQYHQKKVFVTQLKKVYSEMSQAIENCMTETRATKLAETKMFKYSNFSEFVSKYLKTSKTSYYGNSKNGYLGDYYDRLDGSTYTQYASNFSYMYCMLLKDGATVCIYPYTSSADMIVDVNGPAGPNIEGRDLFGMRIDSMGNIVSSGSGLACDPHGNPCGGGGVNMYTAFDRIMQDGWEMNY